MKKRFLLYIIILFSCGQAAKALEIKGKIILNEDWQPVVFLASLNSPENLFVASPDFIISETFIGHDGSFVISTNDVPPDQRFYRLYLVKGNLSVVEFNTIENKNYVHLLLDRNSNIELNAEIVNNSLRINDLKGSHENSDILQFDKELLERKSHFTPDITKARNEYISIGIMDYIRNFVDSTSNALVGLYALYHIEDKNTDFLFNSEFYFNFLEKLDEQYSGTYYSQIYNEVLDKLVGFREVVCEIPGVGPKWKDQLIIAESIIIVVLLLFVVLLLLTNRQKRSKKEILNESQLLFNNLTQKEKEIFHLLSKGKTNKEIALDLFIELSTVKTHINSIYKQLKVSNRKEAIVYYKSLKMSERGV